MTGAAEATDGALPTFAASQIRAPGQLPASEGASLWLQAPSSALHPFVIFLVGNEGCLSSKASLNPVNLWLQDWASVLGPRVRCPHPCVLTTPLLREHGGPGAKYEAAQRTAQQTPESRSPSSPRGTCPPGHRALCRVPHGTSGWGPSRKQSLVISWKQFLAQ